MSEVSNALANLSRTVQSGFSGIGQANVAGANAELARAQTDFRMDNYKKYQVPELEARKQELDFLASPVRVSEVGPPDALAQTHFVDKVLPDWESVLNAKVNSQTGLFEKRDGSGALTHADFKHYGGALAAVTLANIDQGHAFADEIARLKTKLLATPADTKVQKKLELTQKSLLAYQKNPVPFLEKQRVELLSAHARFKDLGVNSGILENGIKRIDKDIRTFNQRLGGPLEKRSVTDWATAFNLTNPAEKKLFMGNKQPGDILTRQDAMYGLSSVAQYRKQNQPGSPTQMKTEADWAKEFNIPEAMQDMYYRKENHSRKIPRATATARYNAIFNNPENYLKQTIFIGAEKILAMNTKLKKKDLSEAERKKITAQRDASLEIVSAHEKLLNAGKAPLKYNQYIDFKNKARAAWEQMPDKVKIDYNFDYQVFEDKMLSGYLNAAAKSGSITAGLGGNRMANTKNAPTAGTGGVAYNQSSIDGKQPVPQNNQGETWQSYADQPQMIEFVVSHPESTFAWNWYKENPQTGAAKRWRAKHKKSGYSAAYNKWYKRKYSTNTEIRMKPKPRPNQG